MLFPVIRTECRGVGATPLLLLSSVTCVVELRVHPVAKSAVTPSKFPFSGCDGTPDTEELEEENEELLLEDAMDDDTEELDEIELEEESEELLLEDITEDNAEELEGLELERELELRLLEELDGELLDAPRVSE